MRAGKHGQDARPRPCGADHAEELKELKAPVKDIDKMLSAQAERLDRQFLARRGVAVRGLARAVPRPPAGRHAGPAADLDRGRRRPPAFADGGAARPCTGDPVDRRAPRSSCGTRSAGEPTRCSPGGSGWSGTRSPSRSSRRTARCTCSPTPKRNTRTYSNRFAAHVLRQHQFHALAAARGWRNRLRLMVDDYVPAGHPRAAAVGPAGRVLDRGRSATTTAATRPSRAPTCGSRTDQVRFYPIDAPENSAHAGGGGYAHVAGTRPTAASTTRCRSRTSRRWCSAR